MRLGSACPLRVGIVRRRRVKDDSICTGLVQREMRDLQVLAGVLYSELVHIESTFWLLICLAFVLEWTDQ